METKAVVRSVHRHMDEPCPTVVYIYWDRRTGKLEAFPPRLQIHVGAGIRWVPFDLSSMQIDGELTVTFPRGESPFRQSSTDTVQYSGDRMRSGAALKPGRYLCTIEMDTQTIDVELDVLPIAAPLATRPVRIKYQEKQIVVEDMVTPVWRNADEVEWIVSDDFEVEFVEQPFTKKRYRPRQNSADGRTGTTNAPPKRYKYKVTHMPTGQSLDPDVEVEDP